MRILSALVLAGFFFVWALPSAQQTKIKVARIPASAQIVFHVQGAGIFVMNADGTGRTQITFDTSKVYQHVAVSFDRRYVVANYDEANSKIMLYDTIGSTETRLVSGFVRAGMGGVEFDPQGRIYFSGVQSLPFPNPSTPDQFLANAGATDIWRVGINGSGLTRITNTIALGETDVSVHPSGGFIAYNAMPLTTTGLPQKYELWVKNVTAAGEVKVFTAPDTERGVFDPELSPDGSEVVFSMRNPDFHNFPNDPNANTAQDIYRVKMDGTGLTLVSPVGPISILPDWKNNEILHMHMSDQPNLQFMGMIVRAPNGTELRRVSNVNMPKFIP